MPAAFFPLWLSRGEENLESYNNINSNTEKHDTVSEFRLEALIYFPTSISLGWWQLKQPWRNSATCCSKCPYVYWFYHQPRLKKLHPTHFSICMCILALFQRNQHNILLLLREVQHSLGSSYVISKTGASYSFFFSVSLNSCYSSSNSWLLRSFRFQILDFKSALWPADKLEVTATWL